jgi:poly(hydroxyalkanoate) depolymerase family esterase
MKISFRRMFSGARKLRKSLRTAVSVQRRFLPLITGVKKTKLPRKPSKSKPSRLSESISRIKRPAPGTFIDASFTSAEGTLAYKLYTPEGSARRKLPLVVMLHGCKQSAAQFAAGTGMNTLADEVGFLVLYPQQSASANIARCWNWHRPGDQMRGGGEPAMVAALTREIIKTCKADSAKVYIAGISAGGAAAGIIGAAYPELYVAVGIHSGVPRGNVTTVLGAMHAMRTGAHSSRTSIVKSRPKPLPTIVFHGDRDSVVHPANAKGFLADMAQYGPEPIAFPPDQGSKGGREFIRTQYRDSGGAILLENWEIRGGQHAWSGGSLAGSYADPAGPDASREMARFFLARKRLASSRLRGSVHRITAA